jgi:hypothetical protein
VFLVSTFAVPYMIENRKASLFLSSDESSFVMGTGLFVDGGVRGGK